MQYKLYRLSPNVLTKTPGQINSYTISAGLIIISTVFLWTFASVLISLLISVFLMPIALYWLKIHYTKKPVYLSVSSSEITYFSDERNEAVTIQADEIEKIQTSFCTLQIHDKNDVLHSISLMNIKSPQTRWEIKEITKKMVTGS